MLWSLKLNLQAFKDLFGKHSWYDSFTLLTDLEKAMQVTARSKNPIPMTCSVFRVTESQTRTCGGNCYKIDTETTVERMAAKNIRIGKKKVNGSK